MKRRERLEAFALQQQGVSYKEIMQRLKIAKSTLWRWLKAEGLVNQGSLQYRQRRLLGQRKGAALVKARRLERTKQLTEAARAQVGILSLRDLWLIGIALYWAEGSKQKDTDVSRGISFSNTDPLMVHLFVEWLEHLCHVSRHDLIFDVYLHETKRDATERTVAFWKTALALSETTRVRVYWKRHHLHTNRHNIGDSYHGLMRVRVRRSTALNRTIAGWIQGVSDALGSGAMAARLTLDQQIPGSNPGSPAIDDGSAELRDERWWPYRLTWRNDARAN